MNAATTSARFDIQHLAQAMRHSSALDAVPLNLSEAHWVTLANYMQPVALQQPFETDADIVVEQLLQPALASAELGRDRRNRTQIIVVLDRGDDGVDEVDVAIACGFRVAQ